MNYTHYDLGGLDKGKTIEVLLQGNAANVYLMTHENMAKYVNGKPFKAVGGLITFSPIRLQTTEEAHWHLVIDMPKGKGMVKTSYRLSKKPPNVSTSVAAFKPTEEQKRAIDGSEKFKPEVLPVAPIIISARPEMVCCQACGIMISQSKFCTECGSPMEKICPGCYIVNTLENKYCYECGYRLA